MGEKRNGLFQLSFNASVVWYKTFLRQAGSCKTARGERPVLPERIGNWPLRSLGQVLVRTRARRIKHARLTTWISNSALSRRRVRPPPRHCY